MGHIWKAKIEFIVEEQKYYIIVWRNHKKYGKFGPYYDHRGANKALKILEEELFGRDMDSIGIRDRQ